MKPKPRERITEQTNPASASLDTKSTREILRIINREDHRVAPAVRKTLPQIARAVDLAVEAIRNGGRLVYLGAGTSGRLGVLDAAECVPTFGTDRVVAILAGAPASLTSSVEGVEDDPQQAVRDLKKISSPVTTFWWESPPVAARLTFWAGCVMRAGWARRWWALLATRKLR